MDNKPLFYANAYYVIHNHGNWDEKIFKSEHHYDYFMRRLDDHMCETWQLIGWCLVPDGFKLIVRIKDSFPQEISDAEKSNIVSRRFSHFANGYAKSINKQYGRRGSLFAKSFKRRAINDGNELREEILLMHSKPWERCYVKSVFDWKFSSCKKFGLSGNEEQYREMIKPFGSIEQFILLHELRMLESKAA